MENRTEVVNYLRQKYERYRKGDNTIFESHDPWINPDEENIPPCSQCLKAYEDYKLDCGKKCNMEHTSACLWYDFFVAKIKRLNPKVVLVLKH